MSQQQEYPSGDLPPRPELQEFVSKVIDDVGPQNLSLKTLRKRLEGEYKIEFTSHRSTLEELVVEKLQEKNTKIRVAKAQRAKDDGSAAPKRKRASKTSPKKSARKEKSETARKPKKEKKPDNYPKAALSAYFLFAADQRKESSISELPVKEQATAIGAKWKEITEEESTKYKELAEQDKERFKRDMDAYLEAGGQVIGRSSKKAKKEKKERVGPKRPQSSYFIFANAKRPEVMKSNPSLKITEVAKEISKLWNEMSAEEKQPYETEAEALKAKYVEECKALGINVSTEKKPRKKAVAADSSSDSSSSDDSSDSDSSDSDSSDSDSSSSSSDSD